METSQSQAANQLIETLASSLGPTLKAVYRFGSEVARGKGAGQERLLVLVDDIDRDLLDRASDPIWTAQKEGVRVRVDSVKNLVRGADAFPAFALELRDHRSLIHGSDVLAELSVSPTHLRLHVEQGLRSMHRELVRLYLERGARPDELSELRRNLRKLVYLLEGALLAASKPVPRPLSLEGAVSACCSTLLAGRSTAPWQTLTQLASAEEGLAQHRPELYAALFDALGQIIDVVDHLEG